MMKNKKRYLYLNDEETRLVLQSLIRFKNKLQQQGRFTDCVDELILKVYDEIQQQISDLKKRFPCIMKVMEDKGEIHLTAEEHAAFVQCLRLLRKLDDMERLQLYFRGHTDAVAYLKKIKAI